MIGAARRGRGVHDGGRVDHLECRHEPDGRGRQRAAPHRPLLPVDLVLWDANGLGAAFEGGLVVPARDGVYLLNYGVASEAPQQFTLISRPIANLYRSYVAAGYLPGQPTVYQRAPDLADHGQLELNVFVDTAGVQRLTCHGFQWPSDVSVGRLSATTLRAKSGATSVHTGNDAGGGAVTSNRLDDA
jgi:hypothetical protein